MGQADRVPPNSFLRKLFANVGYIAKIIKVDFAHNLR